MDNPETKEQNLNMARLSPLRLLKGDVPRLIDEWHLAPSLWDAVRCEAKGAGRWGSSSSLASPFLPTRAG